MSFFTPTRRAYIGAGLSITAIFDLALGRPYHTLFWATIAFFLITTSQE